MKAKISHTRMLFAAVLAVALTCAGPVVSAASLSPELSKKITQSVDDDTQRLTDIFKDIHANPELGFMETRTSKIVAKELEAPHRWWWADRRHGFGSQGDAAED